MHSSPQQPKRRSSTMRDRREYVRVSVDLPTHPKLVPLDDPAACWLYVTSICYSGENYTDGECLPSLMERLAGVDRGLGESLIEAGVWHIEGHDCDRCAQPKRGHVIVHDYLMHNRSASEAERARDQARKGAAARWDADSNADSNAHSIADSNAVTNAEGEGEGEVDKPTPTELVRAPRKARRAHPIRPNWLPDEQAITWAREQGYTDAWCRAQTEQFRDYYTATGKAMKDWTAAWRNWLRKSAQFQSDKGGANKGSTTDMRVAGGLALADKFRQMDEGGAA